MTDELRDSLNQLRKLSPKLNKVTDEAAATVAAIEKFLNQECSIGIPAEVDAWTADEESLSLGYRRCAGQFRIVVIERSLAMSVDDNDNRVPATDDGGFQIWNTVGEVPWSENTRVNKLRTFPSLPQLLNRIAEVATSTIEATEKTAAIVKQIVGTIGTSSATPTTPGDEKAEPLSKIGPTYSAAEREEFHRARETELKQIEQMQKQAYRDRR